MTEQNADAPAEASQFDLVLETAAEPFILADATGRVSRLNPAAARLLQVESAAAAGRMLRDLHSGLGDWLDGAAQASPPGRLDFQLNWEDGRDFEARLRPLLEAGRLTGWVIALQDVTQAARLEQRQSEAIQTVAHDLINPLNLVRGASNLLRDSLPEPSPEQQEYLNMMQTGLDRMAALIEDLRRLEKAESDVTLASLALGDVLQQVAAEFRLAAEEKQVALEFEASSGGGRVLGEFSWLHRAAANLVSNAIKYTPAGGRVSVRYREQDGRGVVEVSDTGPGIPAAAQEHVFQRFYRVPGEATRQAPGSGLGLAIVKTIVERLGGRVWVESAEGRGSTFGFEVPVVER